MSSLDDGRVTGPRTILNSERSLRWALLFIRLGPGIILMFNLLSPVFMTVQNFSNIAAQTSVLAVLAIGQVFVFLVAGIDLSVGRPGGGRGFRPRQRHNGDGRHSSKEPGRRCRLRGQRPDGPRGAGGPQVSREDRRCPAGGLRRNRGSHGGAEPVQDGSGRCKRGGERGERRVGTEDDQLRGDQRYPGERQELPPGVQRAAAELGAKEASRVA